MAQADTRTVVSKPLDKKALAKRRNDFNLHVMLIMRQDDVSKSAAVFAAYCEGDAGLRDRLV